MLHQLQSLTAVDNQNEVKANVQYSTIPSKLVTNRQNTPRKTFLPAN
jgi:hypothetical protein